MTKSRRLLLVCAQCDGEDVGESWCGFKWASELSKTYDVTVLTSLFPGTRSPSEQILNAKVVEWQAFPFLTRFPRFNRAIKPWYPLFYSRVRRWLQQNALSGQPYDVVHQITPMALRYPSPCSGLGLKYIIGPVAGALPTPKKFVEELETEPRFMKLRNLDEIRLRYDPILRRTYEDAFAVICSAPYVLDRLSSLNVRRSLIETEVVLDSLPPFFNRVKRSPGELNLLFVGRVVRTKGVRDAIRALALLKDFPNITFTVVGSGEDLGACRQECEKFGLANRVKFLGQKSRIEVDRLYLNADVFLFPSFREATGIVLFEALSNGLPIIAASVGGPSSIVTSDCGILVQPDSPEQFARDLAEAIRRIASDPNLGVSMSRNALTRAAELGLWQNKIARVSKLYEELIATRI